MELESEYARLNEPPKKPTTYACPECAAELVMPMAGGLLKYTSEAPPDHSERKAEIVRTMEEFKPKEEAAGRKVRDLGSEWRAKQDVAKRIERQLYEARGELAVYEKQAADAGLEVRESNEGERSALEAARERARVRHEAWLKMRDAQRAHENVVEQAAIAALLGPKGARHEYMQEQMDRVRRALDTIEKVTGWLPLGVTADYEVTSNGRPVKICAMNEQRKGQWSIQIALAMLDPHCKWVVLDAADLLRGDSWTGLVNLVDRLAAKRDDLSVVVCATLTERRLPSTCRDLGRLACREDGRLTPRFVQIGAEQYRAMDLPVLDPGTNHYRMNVTVGPKLRAVTATTPEGPWFFVEEPGFAAWRRREMGWD